MRMGYAPMSREAIPAGPVDHALLSELETQQRSLTVSAGKTHRKFELNLLQLLQVSPFFQKLPADARGCPDLDSSSAQSCFEDLDEFAMALFQHWLHGGRGLAGPKDFHSFQHYLGLYVLALKFEIEELQNQVIDHVRQYYKQEDMTAPAFRLDYIYTYTHAPNAMRRFLASSAAYRVLCERPIAPGIFLSDSIRATLLRNSELALDFIDALVWLSKTNLCDPRAGTKCD